MAAAAAEGAIADLGVTLREIVARTLDGGEVRVGGLPEQATVADLRLAIAELLGGTPGSVKLFKGTLLLEDDNAPLGGPEGFDLWDLSCPCMVLRCTDTQMNGDLLKAIRAGNERTAQGLIAQGAGADSDGNAIEDAGSDVIHLVVRAGMVNLAAHLIRCGADINLTNEMGRRPLAIAAIKNLEPLVEELIEAQADIRHRDSTGNTAFDYARRKMLMSRNVLQQLNPGGAQVVE